MASRYIALSILAPFFCLSLSLLSTFAFIFSLPLSTTACARVYKCVCACVTLVFPFKVVYSSHALKLSQHGHGSKEMCTLFTFFGGNRQQSYY